MQILHKGALHAKSSFHILICVNRCGLGVEYVYTSEILLEKFVTCGANGIVPIGLYVI